MEKWNSTCASVNNKNIFKEAFNAPGDEYKWKSTKKTETHYFDHYWKVKAGFFSLKQLNLMEELGHEIAVVVSVVKAVQDR